MIKAKLTLLAMGGGHNPLRVNGIHGGPFLNGVWDCLTSPIVGIYDLASGHRYPLWVHHAGIHYWSGWIVVVLVLLVLFRR